MSTESIDRELTAADILGASDIVTERVDVPEWGGYVYMRALTGKERDLFEESMIDRNTRKGQSAKMKVDNVRAGLVARCLVDADGKRKFNDSQISALGEKSALVLDRLFDKASQLSGIGANDVDDLTADFLEETEEPSTSA